MGSGSLKRIMEYNSILNQEENFRRPEPRKSTMWEYNPIEEKEKQNKNNQSEVYILNGRLVVGGKISYQNI